MEKSKLDDWFCKECDAHFYWLVYSNDSFDKSIVKQPETKEAWNEAELMTDLGMNYYEFYPVGEKGIELNQKPCKTCFDKINVLENKK